MAVYGIWLDADKHIYTQRTEGIWTAAEYADIMPIFLNEILLTGRMVYLLADFTASHNHPRDLLLTAHVIDQHMPRNVGAALLVSTPPSVQSALQVTKRVMPQLFPRLQFADSVEEALHFIQHLQVLSERTRRPRYVSSAPSQLLPPH